MIAPGLYTIDAASGFLDSLAEGLLDVAGGDPAALTRLTVYLPTRRAARSLREAFLRAHGGRPMLLPRLLPVGGLDEDEDFSEALDLPPALPPLRRQLLLARLVQRWSETAQPSPLLPGQATALAGALGRFLDEVQAQVGTLDKERLASLVPGEHAEHWGLVLRFLEVMTDAWPGVLASQGALDRIERWNRAVDARIAGWQERPPAGPVVAAGIVGGLPAIDMFLAAILCLPNGYVVLPGLDRAPHEAVIRDPTHPQFALLRTLQRLRRTPESVPAWPAGRPASDARASLVARAMLPAEASEAWRAAPAELPPKDVSLVECANPNEEAGAIALLMRQTLEVPGRTAALVTPDRDLARRVAAELRRWKIQVDDSAGVPLGRTPPGVFLRLVADAAATKLAPVPLLALLKHPLSASDESPEHFRRAVRSLEKAALRGPRPAPGFAGLRAALDDARHLATLSRIEASLAPFAEAFTGSELPLAELLARHVAAAEALAGGPENLWREDAGEAASRFVAELADAAGEYGTLGGDDYAKVFEALLAGAVVRPAWGRHPRLFIWGLVEARLQHPDCVILGGLNEGVWPAEPGADPWMSRPMRSAFGLRPPEAQIGAAAHDFCQALATDEVFLTRSVRSEGAETVPSRWLLRLDAALVAAGGESLQRHTTPARWHTLLDRPARTESAAPPAPRPPVAARPRQLSATRVETWMRDPYAIYAGSVLRLDALESIDAEPSAADRGHIIHKALERFLIECPAKLPLDAVERLLERGREEFGLLLERPGVWAFWWPRFERIAHWFCALEAVRREIAQPLATERKGSLVIEGPAGKFALTAVADRLDATADGLVLLDYKTGGLPAKQDIELGFAPQLPLEAAIARSGGFPGIGVSDVAKLVYWRLSGSDPAGEEKCIAEGADVVRFADAALEGLAELVRRFDDPATPYRAVPRPGWAPRYSDYAHLARVKEWSTAREEV